MKLILDTDTETLTLSGESGEEVLPLFSREAFEALSLEWVKLGWSMKYPYTFSWLGRPVIQLPEDMIRIQEVIFEVQPSLIIETGVAHGGSLVYYASICKAMGKGRVVGVDIEIRPHNRKAIEEHFLFDYITLIEGDAIAADTVAQVEALVEPGDTVLILLDSCHTHDHVLGELNAYHHLVTPGSYIVATDGVMEWVADYPRGEPGWVSDNPKTAAIEFRQAHTQFEIVQPEWPFNESELTDNITHWPSAYLKLKS